MGKAQKSSATSGTRKKNARKAAAAAGPSGSTQSSHLPLPPKNTKYTKRELKEARKREKVYIPPVKPAPPKPDPLDTTGLASSLPPDLVIVLRGLGKKDVVTRTKALDELSKWIDDATKEQSTTEGDAPNHERTDVIVEMLPVWFHRVPVLFTHPARRVRLLAASLQTSLLRLFPIRQALVCWVRGQADQAELEILLGTWALVSHDVDRGVAVVGARAWNDIMSDPMSSSTAVSLPLTKSTLFSLLSFAQRTVLDPAGLHASLNPVAVPTIPLVVYNPSGKGRQSSHLNQTKSVQIQRNKGGQPVPQAKKSGRYSSPSLPEPDSQAPSGSTSLTTGGDSQGEENESDRNGRLRSSALGIIRWIILHHLQNLSDPPPSSTSSDTLVTPSFESLAPLISSPNLWSILHPRPSCPYTSSAHSHSREDMNNAGNRAEIRFGYGQPQVRRAGWLLLESLIKAGKGLLSLEFLQVLAPAVLRSAWVETDIGVRSTLGGPLLMFLEDYPQAWIIDAEQAVHGYRDAEDEDEQEKQDEADDESESESESDVGLQQHKEATGNVRTARSNPSASKEGGFYSASFREFLSFLELGCAGCAVEGYPLVLVIFAGIPESILPTSLSSPVLIQFLDALWAPLYACLLPERRAAIAWLRTLLECLVFVVQRIVRSPAPNPDFEVFLPHGSSQMDTVIKTEGDFQEGERQEAHSLLAAQFTAVWDALSSRALRVDETDAAKTVVDSLRRLGKIGEDLFQATFDVIAERVLKSEAQSPSLIATFLNILSVAFPSNTFAGRRTSALVKDYVTKVVQTIETALHANKAVDESASRLVDAINAFGTALFEDNEFASRMDTLFSLHALALVRAFPPAAISYLQHRWDARRPETLDTLQMFWTTLLSSSASYASSFPTLVEQITTIKMLLAPFLPLMRDKSLPTCLKGTSDGMDALLIKTVDNAIGFEPESTAKEVLSNVLSVHTYILSSNGLQTITNALVRNIVYSAESALEVIGVPRVTVTTSVKDDKVPETSIGVELCLMRKVIDTGYQLVGEEGIRLYVGIALLAFIVFSSDEDEGHIEETEEARMIWDTLNTKDDGRSEIWEMRQAGGTRLKEMLRATVLNSESLSRPDHIIRALTPGMPHLPIDILAEVLPSSGLLDSLLADLPGAAIPPSLALMDSAIPTTSVMKDICYRPIATLGDIAILPFQPYGRVVSALLTYFSISRSEACRHLWALRHVIAFGVYLESYVQAGDYPNPLIGGAPDSKQGANPITFARREVARGWLAKTRMLTTYLLSRVDDSAHRQAVGSLLKNGKSNAELAEGSIAAFTVEVVRKAVEFDTVRDALVLRAVLQHVMGDATKEDVDLWLTLARQYEKTAHQTAIVILASITSYASEPLKLDRYRNELAANVTGIKAKDSCTIGLRLLRLLCAVAPNPDSDIIFLPQHRAVNVMRTCQMWIAEGDEDDSEDLESAMTLIFKHLAPILQNVPGSHWEFIWDVIESNLEGCSLEEPDTVTTLGRTLQLIITIEDLVVTNKSLREGWEKRRPVVLDLVKNVILLNTNEMAFSDPRALCRELALSIVQDMPSSMMDEKTLPTICHLLTDPSPGLQQLSYTLVRRAAHKFTEYFVIEAGVDVEGTVEPELPAELLAMLQQSPFTREPDINGKSALQNQEASGYLLAWMVAFDLFTDASSKVRSAYFNHLRSTEIFSDHFIPSIFDILSLLGDGKRVFKLDLWAVDEFYLDSYDPASSLSLRLLSAHLYHRALLTVPALIRSWISDCTDKQLLTRVADYTSSYFSPNIIKAELAQVRQASAGSELSAMENLSVKISPGSNEVGVTYTIDEQGLDLSIRVPNDWPLHRLEVRDTKMVGVPENKWRAWVLGVQQLAWQQNGRIVDGLTMFAKNVTLHFAGQVECAICYSIISVIDSSLPQKPCRTCKNRFHASCLYKWFKSSHSSSCPLCRSNII